MCSSTERPPSLAAFLVSKARNSVSFVAGPFPRHELTDGGAGRRRRGCSRRSLVGIYLRSRGLFAHRADAESYLLLRRVHLDDFELVLQARFQFDRRTDLIGSLGVVAEALDSVGDLDERTKARQAQHLAMDDIAHAMLVEESVPDIGLKLLYAQREPTLVRLDSEHDGLHLVALLQHFRRMLHALGPAQVAHVNQAVDAVLDFDECAEVGQVAHLAFHHRADRELFVQRLPRVRLKLLQAKTDAAFVDVYVEYHCLKLIAHVDHLRGMLHPLRPGHLANVHQAFNALLQLDEGSVIGHADYAAFHMRADRVALRGI